MNRYTTVLLLFLIAFLFYLNVVATVGGSFDSKTDGILGLITGDKKIK